MLVTNASPGALEPVLRHALAEIDPNMTIVSVRTMQQQVDLSFDQERAVASLAGTVRNCRARARRDRTLRRDGLHGRAAHQRNRHSHGAGREPRAKWFK